VAPAEFFGHTDSMRHHLGSLTAIVAAILTTACPKPREAAPPSPPAPKQPSVEQKAVPDAGEPQPQPRFATLAAPPLACNPVGIWRVVDKRRSASGGVCAQEGLRRDESNALASTTIQVNQVGWTEGDSTTPANVDMDACRTTFDFVKHKTVSASADGGAGYQIDMKVHRQLSFDGPVVTGTAEVDVTTTPPMPGTPCHATYDVSGKHQ
jgi:hypothetical protein